MPSRPTVAGRIRTHFLVQKSLEWQAAGPEEKKLIEETVRRFRGETEMPEQHACEFHQRVVVKLTDEIERLKARLAVLDVGDIGPEIDKLHAERQRAYDREIAAEKRFAAEQEQRLREYYAHEAETKAIRDKLHEYETSSIADAVQDTGAWKERALTAEKALEELREKQHERDMADIEAGERE